MPAARLQPHSPLAILATAAIGFVAVTALRFSVANPVEAVGFLYVVPISLLASEFGWRAGAAAAGLACALTVAWALIDQVPLGGLGYGARAATFLLVGCLVGVQSERRRSLEREREELIDRLEGMALRDQLTGLPNRRAWDERIEAELARARRSGGPLVVAAIDLDGLKHVNDTLGHERGDQMIRACAAGWGDALRDSDFVARVGGDEFLVLLPDCDPDAVEEIVERMFANMPPAHGFSIGAARWDGEESPTALVRRADEQLYAAKHSGGGRLRTAWLGTVGRSAAGPVPHRAG